MEKRSTVDFLSVQIDSPREDAIECKGGAGLSPLTVAVSGKAEEQAALQIVSTRIRDTKNAVQVVLRDKVTYPEAIGMIISTFSVVLRGRDRAIARLQEDNAAMAEDIRTMGNELRDLRRVRGRDQKALRIMRQQEEKRKREDPGLKRRRGTAEEPVEQSADTVEETEEASVHSSSMGE